MTPPQPGTGAPTPVATPPARAAREPAWAKKVQRAKRVQRESPNDDGWLGAIELVTATFTWGGIGWLIDHFWLHTYPVFMSIGFVVGFFAGMYLLWLKSSREAGPDESTGGAGDGGA